MKKTKYYITFIVLTIITTFSVQAQLGTTYQNWTPLPDSPTHLEVSWMTCKCAPVEVDEIRLFVFNESGNPRTADFTLTISDVGQTDVTYTVAGLALKAAESIQAECLKQVPSELVTPVPAGFNPSTLTISITYN